MIAQSYDLLDLYTKVESTLSISHLEILAIATGATCHRIQLLLRHNHNTPMLGWIKCLQIIYHSTRCVFSISLFAKSAHQELLAAFNEIV